ncbi:BZ3500_MvSof-1268-A1-R1_Chr6-2g08425 [Microbotryum saponariae]|uniref:BZ3500_MvSof-1268-A1-R1_Chr6-2g08425 protein n=1 Tax=Microbotryum saponariae TaxID=289078 RepID=A0A2X0MLF4_9BASI|nr:BZ3500_MvSof-1268-A1-R1_Chr6-2g08425 [Microbotryum saponariae]SDA07702.1 BZ3501_MvSof-1269-A2-R1_Chr6-1g08139 [Microbotryum saponariae]
MSSIFPQQPSTPSTSTSTSFASPTVSTVVATASGGRLGAGGGAGTRRRHSTRVRETFAALAAQEKALASDPKYRKYAQSVERTLQSFDQVNEWADFITFLAKLLKCLQAYPQFVVIPHKLIVAKRLSQCLNPALPTGVHQRALDVYTHILTTIGTENLRRDLPAWSSGIFPFFQYAATSVKPIVLSIFERFYLPLQESLRPATKAFILALLPGLEEETGEFFEKVAALLDRVSGAVSPSFFFQNVWLVLVTAPGSRIPALNYLSRRLPKLQSEDGLTYIVGQDIGLMIRGFSAALEDAQILVQRGILDLLTATLKLDSRGFRATSRQDQVLLMRSVLGVVLRRDLSLSRRLYSWLLGTNEGSEAQVAYLKEHGLELVREALKLDMDAQSVDSVDRQRPFKIFISLLDKWEIGAALTEVLVLDAFAALKVALRPNDDHDELLMTGNMLFEILDPFLMWKAIYFSMRSSIVSAYSAGSRSDILTIELVRFIVATFRLHDEEVQKLHAPFVAFGLIDLVEQALTGTLQIEQGLATRALEPDRLVLTTILQFVVELIKEVSPHFYDSNDALVVLDPPEDPHLGQTLADLLYGATDMKTASLPETEGRELLASGLASTTRVIQACVEPNSRLGDAQSRYQTNGGKLLLDSLRVLLSLFVVTESLDTQIKVAWEPETWAKSVVGALERTETTMANWGIFGCVVWGLSTVMTGKNVRPTLKRNRRDLLEAIAAKLLEYLQPSGAPCFVEAVQMLWAIESFSDYRLLETMISERLASPDPAVRLAAFEAFGNLWRFTEDSQLPGVVLRTPMFRMLDSLKADDLSTRRAGEAWMRCSLKSYLRILDPLLFTLLDPSIEQRSTIIKVADLRVPILEYEATFDQARVHHVLDCLLGLARFGGQGFIRIAKGSFMKHSLDPSFRERVRAADLDAHTYLDGLIIILMRFLRAEPNPKLVPSLGPLNYHIHSVVAELLQVVMSRGEAEITGLSTIESALTSRLYLCVHRGELDLQNKLLHVLHSVVHAVAGSNARRHRRAPSVASTTGTLIAANELSNEAQPPDMTHDAMFVRVVSDGVTTQNNNAVIHHWIDFLLMTIPQFRQSLHSVLFPLIDCLVQRLRSFVGDFEGTYGVDRSELIKPLTSATDAEFTVLVNALERLLLIAIAESNAVAPDEEPKTSTAMSSDASAGTGLLGYMSGVLGSAEVEVTEVSEATKTKHATLLRLRDCVVMLLQSWDVSTRLEILAGDDVSTSMGHFAARAKLRARKALERIYKSAPSDSLDDIAAHWQKLKDSESEARVFEMVGILAPSAQSVVSMICEKLGPLSKGATSSNQHDKNRSPYLASDELLFAFLEAYLDRLDGAMSMQVWSTCLGLVRDCLSNISTSRPHIFACLRCFTTLSEKVSQTSALEDRRMRRDLQETFIRLADASIQLAGRSVDQSGWLRKGRTERLNGEGESAMSKETKETEDVTDDEKRALAATPSNHALDITDFLTRRVLPDFRRFLIDSDKTAATCSNMVYYIVAPAFKTRSKTFEVEPAVFSLLHEMVKNPATVKAWKTMVSDAFGDNRFFNAPPTADAHWRPVIQAFVASDKERLVELTSKISSVSSANIFTNRELENLSRALSLRRLTYVLFTGDKDRFLTQLPMIQEKLVDLLRSSVGDMVHAEVYLCLRVLFVRIGNQHLSGLWPTILTDLLRLFDSLVEQSVPDKSDLLQLVHSACKFLDLTLVLQTEDFQIHEWMFVTDTVDAMYPPDSWLPQAIMDRLGEIIHDGRFAPSSPSASISPVVTRGGGVGTASESTAAWASDRITPRRPMLVGRRVNTIGDLIPFFSTVSLAAYESVYGSGGRIDHEAVEKGLARDLFDFLD